MFQSRGISPLNSQILAELPAQVPSECIAFLQINHSLLLLLLVVSCLNSFLQATQKLRVQRTVSGQGLSLARDPLTIPTSKTRTGSAVLSLARDPLTLPLNNEIRSNWNRLSQHRTQNIYFKAIIEDIYTRQFECYITNHSIL